MGHMADLLTLKTYILAHTLFSLFSHECISQDLMNIAMTTLSSKILTGDKEHFARLAVDAILRLKGECSFAKCNGAAL